MGAAVMCNQKIARAYIRRVDHFIIFYYITYCEIKLFIISIKLKSHFKKYRSREKLQNRRVQQ